MTNMFEFPPNISLVENMKMFTSMNLHVVNAMSTSQRWISE